MANRETVEIGGKTVHVIPFDPFLGLEIFGDIQKQFLAPLLSMVDGREAGNEAAVTAAFLAGVERVLRDMDGKRLVATAKRLISSEHVMIEIDGGMRKLEHGLVAVVLDLADLVDLCYEIARINFAPLFSRLFARIGGAIQFPPMGPSTASPAGSRPN